MSCYLCGKNELTVFSCPKKDGVIREQWFKFCDLGDDKQRLLRLCENHFHEADICRKQRTILRKSAVPRLSPQNLRIRKHEIQKATCELCIQMGYLDSPRENISYFKFPKDPILKKRWIDFCELKEEEVSPKARLCARHFLEGDIINLSDRRYLRKGTVPEIFDFEDCEAYCATAAYLCHTEFSETNATLNDSEYSEIDVSTLKEISSISNNVAKTKQCITLPDGDAFMKESENGNLCTLFDGSTPVPLL